MLRLLRERPLRVMRRRPGGTVAFGLDFRTPIPLVAGFNLRTAPDASGLTPTLVLELLDEMGAVVSAALLPWPELEDLT